MFLGEIGDFLGVTWKGKISHASHLLTGNEESFRRLVKDLDQGLQSDPPDAHRLLYHRSTCASWLGYSEVALVNLQGALVRSENPVLGVSHKQKAQYMREVASYPRTMWRNNRHIDRTQALETAGFLYKKLPDYKDLKAEILAGISGCFEHADQPANAYALFAMAMDEANNSSTWSLPRKQLLHADLERAYYRRNWKK